MATSTDRPTQRRAGASFGYSVKAGAVIHRGAIAVLEEGLLTAGKTALGLTVVGIAPAAIDNSAGADGDSRGEAELGCFRFENSAAGDAISDADAGEECFLVDDETVAKTDGGGTRSRAGLIRGVDASGVWVQLDGRK